MSIFQNALAHLSRLLQPGNSSIAARMSKGAAVTLVLKISNIGLVFATTVMLARLMGITSYGVYAYAMSWITLLGIFANLGLESVVSRNVAAYYHARDWQRIDGLLRTAFIAVATAATLCIVAAGVAAGLMFPADTEMRWALWLALLLLPLNALAVPLGAAQAGFQRVIFAQIPVLLLQPLGFAMLVLVAWLLFPADLTVLWVLSLYLLASCGSLGAGIYFLRRSLKLLRTSQSQTKPIYEARRWLTSALPMIVAGSMFLLNSNADILMLGTMSGPEDAAVYKTASRGAELVVFVLAVVNAPLAPMIAKLHVSGDRIALQRIITQSARLSFAAGTVIAGLLVLFGQNFLAIFGPEYVRGSTALSVLCMGQLALLTSGPAGFALAMTGHERKLLFGCLITAVINVMLNWLLIPRWGLEGAAVATAISSTVWAAILTGLVWTSLGIDPTWLGTNCFKRRPQ